MNYIIDFKDDLTIEQIDQYLSDNGLTKIKEYSFFDRVYLVSSPSVIIENDFIEKVVADNENGIQLLNLDISLVHDAGTETSFSVSSDDNWWKTVVLDNIDFDAETHTFTRYGSNTAVYILDSGLNHLHPEFSVADITLLHSHTNEFIDNHGHGTALASLVSGDTCGLTNAKIKVVKIFDSSQPTLQSDLLAAFDAVANDYISNNKIPSIVNCSWTIPYNEYINAKIQQLIDIGLFVVAAAGNNGLPIVDVTPACIPDVLTVGSFGQDLTPSDFSNYTDPSFISFTQNETNYGELDGWAPGEKIQAAMPNGNLGYIAGTSASAAIASAAIAYNINKYIDSNGNNYTLFSNYINYKQFLEENAVFSNTTYNTNDVYRDVCLGKKDLLDLTDAKYTTSVNRIVGYRNSLKKYESSTMILSFISGTTMYNPAFNYRNITRITSDSELPDYLNFEVNGLLRCNAPLITEEYVITETPISVYYTDGSVINQTLKVIVFREDVSYANMQSVLPPDDPVLQLTLSSSCSFSGYCFNDDCVTYYGPYYGCYSFGPKAYDCACQFGSDILLKENIELIDTIENINIYSFSYKSNPNRTLKGVMAQELLNTKYRTAVSKHNGYYVVNYCMLPGSVVEHCELV